MINKISIACGVIALLVSAAARPVTDNCLWPDSGSLEAVIPVAVDDGSYASGVVVDKNQVLTAAHAVSYDHRVFVGIHHTYRAARIVLLDHNNDLAILSVNTDNIRPLRIAKNEPYTDQPVWAVGFPRAQAKTTSAGFFQRMSHGALHTSAPIDSGQSGGGLLSCVDGSIELIGMLRGFGAYLQGDHYVKLENHSVSVAAPTIQRFVDLRATIQ